MGMLLGVIFEIQCVQLTREVNFFKTLGQGASHNSKESVKDLSRVKGGFKSVPFHQYFEFRTTFQHWIAQRF